MLAVHVKAPSAVTHCDTPSTVSQVSGLSMVVVVMPLKMILVVEIISIHVIYAGYLIGDLRMIGIEFAAAPICSEGEFSCRWLIFETAGSGP